MTVVDRGSTSCEFMRSTVNQVPAFPSTANTAHVPMALICQPFAELTPYEAEVPCVDLGEPGTVPIAYRFLAGGQDPSGATAARPM